jgi:hypothetical protein|tara:strand:- start:58 stop:807 length:750 start_codon:yes stop_codon:yes gene_type:complete
MIMEEDDSLLLEICRCPNVALAKGDSSHPCSEVVSVQSKSNEFQLPEPWTGDLINSRLLIIASNPSIDESEAYPTSNWEDRWIIDFFKNRFDENYGWTQEGLHVLQKDRVTFAERHVPYWAEVRKQAERIYGRETIAGVDYTLTEVVHCKSRGREGVKSAAKKCSKKWLEPIIGLSPAKVLLVLGDEAGQMTGEFLGLDESRISHRYLDYAGSNRWILFVPAPGSNKPRKIDEIISEEELLELRDWINS